MENRKMYRYIPEEDDTPINDLREQIKDHQKQIQHLKKVLDTINNLCNSPHWTAKRRWRIEVLSSRKSYNKD